MFNRRSQLGMIASAWVLAGCSFASNTDDNIGSVTPIPPAVAESNPLRTLNSPPAAPVLNTGNFPATSGSTTPPGAPRPPPSAAEFANMIDRRPLVIIRFDRPNVPYEEALYIAVSRALDRRPDVVFDLVAVAPQLDDPSQIALHSEASKRNVDNVFRSLTTMGVPAERVSLSATTNASAQSDEVRLYVR